MKKLFLVTCIGFAACTSQKTIGTVQMTENPFFSKSTLQYQAPQFDKISNEHFAPAFDEGMAVQRAEYDKIAKAKDAPTFKNTVEAIELSGEILNRARRVFSNFTSANTNKELQDLQARYAPIFAAHNDALFLNDAIFQRLKKVYEMRNNSGLNAEQIRLTEFYFQRFEMRGANLSPVDKEKLKVLNARIATLETEFSRKLLEARRSAAVLVTERARLDGLTADEIAAAAENARKEGQTGYLLLLTNTTQQPQYSALADRDLREKIFNASWSRAEKNDSADTRAIVEELVRLRLQFANLLGKPNFAAWKLQDQMAKEPKAAMQLLTTLAGPAQRKAKEEVMLLQEQIKKDGQSFLLQPWDWNYYAEKLRKEKYDLDENEVKPYFEVNNVLEKGVFYAAEKFYSISFKQRPDLPVYHPDVVAYEIFDADGQSLAIYYLDFFTRDNKSGGAWMSNYVPQSHVLEQKPVIVNVFNYSKPAEGKPSLISFDDVETMFHEFGHTLHGLFADQQYVSLSGTSTPRDFVEFPSQVNEMWTLYPDVLKNYAVHYATGQPMPLSLAEKLKTAAKFNSGYINSELLESALIDMEWHTVMDVSQFKPTNEFEKQALKNVGFDLPQVPPRYHTPYFAHIWSSGYSAGYYAYVWSQNLDANARAYILKNGGLNRSVGDRYRKYILSVGNTRDLNQQFEQFTGQKPDIKALLDLKGL